jgi:hypothetical protein
MQKTNLSSPLQIKYEQQKVRVTGLHPNILVSRLHEFIAILLTLNDPMDAHSIWFLSEAKCFLASAAQEEAARYTGSTVASFDRRSYSKSNGQSLFYDFDQINPHNFLNGSYNERHSSTGVYLERIAVVQTRDRIPKSVSVDLTLRRPSSDDDDEEEEKEEEEEEEEDATHQKLAHIAAEAQNPGPYLDMVLSRAT